MVPETKPLLLKEADKKVEEVEDMFDNGLLSDGERKKMVIGIWENTTKKVTNDLMGSLDEFNPIYMMANSGARGSTNQIRQLAGMRGLMADPSGEIIEVPIRANFREGLTVLEFFISSHGARKGLADTALRTADSGYLTRRLVDVSQDVIVREDDCFAARGEAVKGMPTSELREGNKVVEQLDSRIVGRYTVEDVVNPNTGEVIVPANTMIGHEAASEIVKAGVSRSISARYSPAAASTAYAPNATARTWPRVLRSVSARRWASSRRSPSASRARS
jgi:DNA-directed RNA polymerase subunit beta'